MSSDSDHTYPVTKRKKFIITDSDNSDDSIVVQTRRRKTFRVVSEGESSDDSDVPKPVIRRRKKYRFISEDEASYDSASEANKSAQIDSSSDTSSEWQSDWSSSDELEKNIKTYNTKRRVLSKTKKKEADEPAPPPSCDANVDSDNSDEQLEKCPICLLPFRKQQVATPSACEHCFCLECLLEWSKNINTCPVDRQIFTVIHVRSHLGGKITKHLPIEVAPRFEVPDDPTFCEVCHLSDREDRMLLCDGCDCGYHLECLTPPMTEVPMEEWFCPECSQNSQNDAEAIEIDLDEISDLMEEARRLGVSYGRSRTGVESGPMFSRIVPRTRHTERVRANIRNRAREVRNTIADIRERFIDPNQPSTSSGLDSIGDNSRSRSPNINFHACNDNTLSSRSNATSKTKTTKRKRKKSVKKNSQRSGSNVLREVRIREINDDGEEEEIVTYVKVSSSTSRRKCKKRTKKTRKKRKHKRYARTVSSVLARTVKRRLATTLGMVKPKLEVPLLVPTMRNNISVPEKSALRVARYSAGIPQVNLFGNNLGLDYSPPGSDDDEYSIGNGPMVNAQRRSAVPSIRRRAILKTIANPVNELEDADTPDILDSIISSQELWHSSKKSNMVLKADGTLLVNNPEKENKHSINNNESPKKEKEEVVTRHKEVILKEVDTPLDLSNVNPNDITQAPMYNNPCGSGNRGNFRGGYRDNSRHSHHGGQNYGGGRDSLPPGNGRHGYASGGSGTGPRDNFGNRDFGPPPFYNPSFEHCGGPPMFSNAQPPPFRSRNPQHFRNERLRFPPPVERPFNNYVGDSFERPPFPHAQDHRFPRPRPPLPPLGIPPPPPPGPSSASTDATAEFPNVQSTAAHVRNSLPPGLPETDITRNYQSERSDLVPEPVSASLTARQDNDDCDIYCDIEPPSKQDCDISQEEHGNGAMILLPPPEPPSGLLDFEENSRSDKDNDSEQELVIDDSHKEEHMPKDLTQSGDKYDPFAADSDSNDDNNAANSEKALLEKTEMPQNAVSSCNIPMPVMPPPLIPRPQEPPIRLTAYDDDDGDNDSQSDCPNFSIYSSQTMDVARHTEQELSQQLGPLQPPPLPPSIPDDDDIIVGDVQACDLPDIPEPANPYLEALQKERQTLSKIPPKKISHDLHRDKITFKIGNKRLNNRLSGLHDDHGMNSQNATHQSTADGTGDKGMSQRADKQKQQCHDQFVRRDSKRTPLIGDSESQERDANKSTISSSKPAESASRSSIPLNQSMKVGSRFLAVPEQDENAAKTTMSFKKKEPLKSSRRDSKEHSENSSDEETMKEEKDEKLKRTIVDSSLSPGKEAEDSGRGAPSPRRSAINAYEKTIEASSSSSLSLDKMQLSPKKMDINEMSAECSLEDPESGGDDTDKNVPSRHSGDSSRLRSETSVRDNDSQERESSSDDYDDRSPSNKSDIKVTDPPNGKDDDRALSDDNDNEDPIVSSDQQHEKASSNCSVDDEVEEQFPIEKDKLIDVPPSTTICEADSNWDSDGAYTPCKDELPVRDEDRTQRVEHAAPSFELGGLEPITPTKDKVNDDLDDCETPSAGYAGLGTEDISETDEAINFEEDPLSAPLLRKEKEMEDGEIPDENKLNTKEREKSKEREDDNKKKKKKDKKEKSKESTEKNKENISSDNLVSWKKISKSTKERPYRDKDRRSKSREKEKEREKDKSSKKKTKEMGKKKEKRKELPRYDVRKIVKPRKDEYGRDVREKSRSGSRSRSSKISGSKDRRSRSYSKGRSRSRSRLRLSWSRDRRSYSKSCRSTSRRRSSSRTRRKSSRRRSMSRRRSLSRRHSVSRRRSRSLSRKRRSSLSPRRRSRRRSLSRSRDKRKDKTKKYKSRSRSRNRKRSRSKSPKRATSKSREKKHSKRKVHSRSRSKGGRSCSRDRDRNARNWDQLNEKNVDQHGPVEQQREFPREREERSWSAQWTPSWSQSRSKTPPHMQQEIGSRNWSPPPVLDSVSPKNLTVILTNKEAIKKKKKERRKESRKSKENEKRRKGKRNRTPPPSKEVFASGDNILVSVCFNKDNETNPTATPDLPEAGIPLAPPLKRRRRESVQTEASAKRSKKEKSKDKRSKSPKIKKDKKKKSKAAEIAATKKPVAVIDLDQSPFREQTPSPRDVIVLSDDDDKQAQEVATPEQCPPSQVASPPREQFVSQGPKTPPEPQIKFSINKQPSNLRPSLINPLLDEEEEEEEMEEEEMIDERVQEEMRTQEDLEQRLKIGPNTPPEPPTSPPTSPDAYDPFDPTKSRSPTPDASQEATPNDERDRVQRNSPRKHDTVDTPLPDEPSQPQEQPSQEKQLEKPKIISMVTIKRASPQRDSVASPAPENQADIAQSCNSPPKTQQNQQNVQSTANPFAAINPVLATVAAAVQRSAVFNANTSSTAQRTLLQSNRISPSSQMKQRTNDRPQLPNIFTNSAKSTMARSSKSTQNKNSSTIGQNGSDATIDMTNDNVDMSSPYSPGSTLSDGLFDPPSPANFNSSPVTNAPPTTAKSSNTPKINKSAEKKDAFDALFGGILPPVKTASKSRSKKVAKEKTKKSTNPKVGVRMDENQLQILDDLPSSAVEMQVKDKFLKKLNRQERVVEEVKLVLKPHYTKKHVTKEEYKDIMRKAVPKICHNKTGEINPKKIAHLIEAYVRKCRNNKKKTSAKTSKPTKTLWS